MGNPRPMSELLGESDGAVVASIELMKYQGRKQLVLPKVNCQLPTP